jgi:phage shock protein A
VLQATQASDQAKAAVQQNATQLQRKLAERQKLLSQLDQAKMQEQLNTAMASLSETVGQDVPTFDEIRGKIEARYAKAKGLAEIQEQSVDSRILEIEQATVNIEAQSRLDSMRAELGLPTAGGPAALGTPAAGALQAPASALQAPAAAEETLGAPAGATPAGKPAPEPAEKPADS